MRVLWICNNVLTDFCHVFGLKWNFSAGWATGMLHALKRDSAYDIGLCFPIIDEFRMKAGNYDGTEYYSFHMNMNDKEYDASMSSEFETIIKDFRPDIVHIWGTERNNARAAFEACAAIKGKGRGLVYIQGIAAQMGLHYTTGIPQDIVFRENESGVAEIAEEQNLFSQWGETEQFVLENAQFVTGRTEWDHAWVQSMNPNAAYVHCNEILRDAFYHLPSNWAVESCKRHTVFLSQAHYPIKGFHILIKALPMILDKYPDTEVRVGGFLPRNRDGSSTVYGQWLNDLMIEYGVRECVHFLGVLNEARMIEEYLNANVYVLPSVIDNSPNSIAEAMMLGTPIVASYVGGVPSMVRHAENGLLYPHDEHFMLAHYVVRVFGDDELAARMSLDGQRTASKRHNPERVCAEMEKIYSFMATS